MTADGFWEDVDDQLVRLSTARSPEEVFAICPPVASVSVGAGFFFGDGDDVMAALFDAGWILMWSKAPYYWAMWAPYARAGLTYVEGDLERGVTNPSPVS